MGLNLELIKYHSPPDDASRDEPPANRHGIGHICFVVDDIEAVVARVGAERLISAEIAQYEDTYKLCYLRGPEGIIVELAQALK